MGTIITAQLFDKYFDHIAFGTLVSAWDLLHAHPSAELNVFPCKYCAALVAWDHREEHIKWHIQLEESV